MKHLIRRSIRAALTVVSIFRRTEKNLTADLFRAIDRRCSVIIDYTDSKGIHSRRVISPIQFLISAAGDIRIKAHDHRDQDNASFRLDRIHDYALGW